MKLIFVILMVFVLTFSVGAQSLIKTVSRDLLSTNSLYNAGETVIEFAPTISSPNIFASKTFTYGYSFEVEHWMSQYAGAGVEFGNYDYLVTTYGIIDHIALTTDFRYVPFKSDPFFNRLALGWKTGAETFFVDGSKDVEFGGEVYWHFSKNLRLEADIMQHERTNPNKNGQTGRVAIQWLF